MKKLILFFIAIFCLTFLTSAQTIAPAIEWQNTIFGNNEDLIHSIISTSDGGCLLGGSSNSGKNGDKTEKNQGDHDYWVVKLDASSNIEWQNTIGGDKADYLLSVIQTNDGGYLLGGYTLSGISGDKTEVSQGLYDYWVVKLDGSGNIEWQNTIGGNGNDMLHSIIQTTDGGYLLGGDSGSNISGDKTEVSLSPDFWIIKLDVVGNIEWQNTVGGSVTESLWSMRQTSDEGYIVGGYSTSGISGDKTEAQIGGYDYWVVKLDSSGNIQWQNTIGGSDYDYLYSVIPTNDNAYLLAGSSTSGISGDKAESSEGEFDYWVLKLDGSGNIQWQNTIGGDDADFLYSAIQTTDGGYLLGGSSESGLSGDKTEALQGGNDYWVIKLDDLGNIQWQNTIGGNDVDHLASVSQATDGGFLLGGWSESEISGDKTESGDGGGDDNEDYWVVKLYPEQCLGFFIFPDEDNDTYGDPDNSLFAADCIIDAGFVANNLDCDDANAAVHPEVTELINGIDDNCNGLVDECYAPTAFSVKNVTSNSAKLKWSPEASASSYKLRYKEASTSTWTLLSPQGHSKTLENLTPETDYVWQVRSVCGTDQKVTSDWSPKQFFTTVSLKMDKMAEQSLCEIFPNPAKDYTTIQFTLIKSSSVSISIYDASGRIIKTLMNENLKPDSYNLQYNTTSLSKGIYLVRIVSENGIHNQKLIIQ